MEDLFRKRLDELRVSTVEIQYEDWRRSYDVISADLSSAPLFFTGYGHGRPFISEQVPENYREPMVLHEIDEFEKFQRIEGRCLGALKLELEWVSSKEFFEDYIVFRLEVFNHLINFLKKDNPNSFFIPEAMKSAEHLKSLKK